MTSKKRVRAKRGQRRKSLSLKSRLNSVVLVVLILLFVAEMGANPGVLWAFVGIVGATAFLLVFWKLYRAYAERQRLKRARIDEIDQMDGWQFEKKLAVLFQQMGYKVELTPSARDFGADLILQSNGERIAVQAKRYSKNVGVHAVQEVVGSKRKYNCQGALVVTNSFFTRPAQELAEDNDVELWGRDKLVWELSEVARKSAA
jgi:restriction system protein